MSQVVDKCTSTYTLTRISKPLVIACQMRSAWLLFIAGCVMAVFGEFPACKLSSGNGGYCTNEECSTSAVDRIVAIGDIHGSFTGLLEDLYNANITRDKTTCEWRAQDAPVLFLQIGDIVDRGAGALETWKCLRKLQADASTVNSRVVRLLGNHELWWLEGYLHHRNKTADTYEKIVELIQYMMEDILDQSVVVAYTHRIADVPILFSHAGVSPKFLTYLKDSEGVASDVDAIAAHLNDVLLSTAKKCSQIPCPFKGEVFDSGPDRGGRGIGGPFWTDFSTLEAAALKEPNHDFIQVVGHSMAWCYSPARIGFHPPKEQDECALGLVRASQDMQAVCIDGGMYAGARAYLEIDKSGRFFAHEYLEETTGATLFTSGVKHARWTVRDLTAKHCENKNNL